MDILDYVQKIGIAALKSAYKIHEKLGDKKFLAFAQDTHAPIITAATAKLANRAVVFFKSK